MPMRPAAALLLALALLLPAPPTAIALTPTRPDSEVHAYLPYWSLPVDCSTEEAAALIRPDLVSDLLYFGIAARADGSIDRDDPGTARIDRPCFATIRALAKTEGINLRVSLRLFGWSANDAARTRTLLGDPELRARLAEATVTWALDHGFDGVDLDVEPLPADLADGYADLAERIASQLPVSIAITLDAATYPLERLVAPSGPVSRVFLMGYDVRSAASAETGSISPLAGRRFALDTALARIAGRVDPGALVLGLPLYGRAWTALGPEPHSPTASAVIDGQRLDSSASATARVAEGLFQTYAPARPEIREASDFVAYQRAYCLPDDPARCVTVWRQLWWEGAERLAERADLARRGGLAGVGLWALGYADPPLLDSLRAALLADRSAPSAALIRSAREGALVRVTLDAHDDQAVSALILESRWDGGSPVVREISGSAAELLLPVQGERLALRVAARDAAGRIGAWSALADGLLGDGSLAAVAPGGINLRADPAGILLETLPAGARLRLLGAVQTIGAYTYQELRWPADERLPGVRGWVRTNVDGRATLAGLDERVRGGADRSPLLTYALRTGRPTATLSWSATRAIRSLRLELLDADGRLLRSQRVGNKGAGRITLSMDLTGIPAGRYLLRAIGTRSGISSAVPTLATDAITLRDWGLQVP